MPWRNRLGVGPGRQSVPLRDFWPGNFCWPIGKERQGKKEKWSKKEGKSKKGREVENWKWNAEKLQNEERTFFFFFFFFPPFKNHWNLFWVYQNGNFLAGRSISRRGKKSGKTTLPPLKNIPLRPLSKRQLPQFLRLWASGCETADSPVHTCLIGSSLINAAWVGGVDTNDLCLRAQSSNHASFTPVAELDLSYIMTTSFSNVSRSSSSSISGYFT